MGSFSFPACVFCIFCGSYVLLALLYSIHLLLSLPDISTESFQSFKLFYTNISNHVFIFHHSCNSCTYCLIWRRRAECLLCTPSLQHTRHSHTVTATDFQNCQFRFLSTFSYVLKFLLITPHTHLGNENISHLHHHLEVKTQTVSNRMPFHITVYLINYRN
jgi:hypothetical protein